MAETTHDFGAVDDGFHEIHLSGKQLVFLFIATTIVSVLIFLLGVMVGRGVPAERQAGELADPTTSAAAAPAPTAPVTSEAPPPAAEGVPADEPEDLTYKKRLESTAPLAEELKSRESPPAEKEKALPTPSVQAQTTPPPQRAVAGSPQPGAFVVQVLALTNRSTASGIVQRLAKKGYPAFLVSAGPPTNTYKVQVGRFKDRGEAQRVVERLRKEEQFAPWIIR